MCTKGCIENLVCIIEKGKQKGSEIDRVTFTLPSCNPVLKQATTPDGKSLIVGQFKLTLSMMFCGDMETFTATLDSSGYFFLGFVSYQCEKSSLSMAHLQVEQVI